MASASGGTQGRWVVCPEVLSVEPANTWGLLMMCRRNYIFSSLLWWQTLYSILFFFPFSSFSSLGGSLTSCDHLEIAMNKSYAATKDPNIGKAHGAPLLSSCVEYSFWLLPASCEFGKWGIDVSTSPCWSFNWFQPVEGSKLISWVDANLFRRACSFGRCYAFHYIRDSAVSREGNMHIQGLL